MYLISSNLYLIFFHREAGQRGRGSLQPAKIQNYKMVRKTEYKKANLTTYIEIVDCFFPAEKQGIGDLFKLPKYKKI